MGGVFERSGSQSWDPAQVQMPEMPMLPPGEDPMSATISAVLPTLGAPLDANIAALQGKETMFAGKVGASNAMYAGSEDSGEQGVMQVVQSLGQMAGQAGQMGEMAGGPGQMLGQMGSQFGQLMQPMMQAFQSAGHGGGAQSPGGLGAESAAGGAGGGAGGMAGAQQQERDDDKAPAQAQPEPQHDTERDDRAMAGPQAGPGETRHGLSPIPVLPPEQPRHDEGGDLSRRV